MAAGAPSSLRHDLGVDAQSDLEAALSGVRAAARVAAVPTGLTRPQRQHMASVIEQRVREAVAVGATSAQIAGALGVGRSAAQQRILRARRTAPPPPPVAAAPSIWRTVPRCARPAPPPWPVSARCRADAGHDGDHDFGPQPGQPRL